MCSIVLVTMNKYSSIILLTCFNRYVLLTANAPITTSLTGNTVSTTAGQMPTTGSAGGAVHCPAFDAINCNPTCIGMDRDGCLSCACIPQPPGKREHLFYFISFSLNNVFST